MEVTEVNIPFSVLCCGCEMAGEPSLSCRTDNATWDVPLGQQGMQNWLHMQESRAVLDVCVCGGCTLFSIQESGVLRS